MIVQRKEETEGFKPITLTIKLETLSDLKFLWNSLNNSDCELSDASKKYGKYPMEVCEMPTDELWDAVNTILDEL